MTRASALALVIGLGAVTGSSAAPGHARFKPGIYSATTSQGSSFTFKVVAHTASNDCGTHAGQHCFYAKSYPAFTWTCAGTQTTAGPFDVPNGFVSAAGKFSYSQPLQGDQQPLLRFTAVLSGSKATGSFREEQPDDSSPGSTATCDSGVVTWTGKKTS